MTCTMHGRGFEAQVDDYVDGTLSEAERTTLEAHLGLCPACRHLAADLQAIRTAARTLEPQVPPSHVWTRIAASMEGRPQRRTFADGWLARWQPLAAAAAAVLIVASLSWVGGRLAPAAQGPARAATGAPGYPDAIDAAYRDAETQYATAIAGLEQITAAQRDALDPETADVLNANLNVIDMAITESRTALRQEPQSEVAQDSLFGALRQKLALLQDTLALINEMRKGNEEGAARILSELNP